MIFQDVVHWIGVAFHRIKFVASEKFNIVVEAKNAFAGGLKPVEAEYCLFLDNRYGMGTSIHSSALKE
jgi:hypothetical protein